ncbi:Exportin-1/Importin-beta-like protein [Gossypium australe]|uniref:Exportin-1/Importin-beta-like protein n=1 Tax=Gossypium australe TaxID=47621 RepID=A0A5B6WY81_9ROSI|nr:Exportin-1/Importin-beta-like protein [Gossypium australe]
MLQHLVRLRWEEFSPSERRNFSNVAVELMSEIADPCEEWALKSQTAALVAEVVRREGLNLWQELFPSLVSLSSKGPVQAELVSMMLRWLPEDITVHNEDLEGDRRRLLLRGLTQSLPEILPLLYTLLERHFGEALSEVGRQHLDIAKQHAAAVTATLNAINAYAEWAPLSDLAKFGIIHGCGFLLSSPDFRLHACEFFKLVSPRKRPADDFASEFDSAMSSIFQILMNVSREFLVRSNSAGGAIDESDFEFAEYVCESMVSLGSSNLQCILGDSTTSSLYLQQALMRDLMSKPKLSVHSSGEGSAANNADSNSAQVDNEKRKISSFLNDDICSTILDISFQRMLKKERLITGKALSLGALELWSDDFEGKGDFGQYRSRLFELIKFIASNKPLVAGAKDPSTSSARHARLQICTSFIRIAKAADKSILPHMKGIADTMAYLQREGRLLRGEHNLLGEAFLVMASAAGVQQQQEVLAWLLEPLSQQWIQIEWQNNYLSEPLGLVCLCSETAFMWSLFHTITFFEKALKRSGMRKGQSSSTSSSTPHPMASHLSWMLPPLLKLLRAIHSLWSPSVFQVLPGEIKAAMSMSDVERSSLLGVGNPKLSKGALTFIEGSPFDVNKEGYTEPNEADIRNWLKGIRDSG